MPENSKNPAIRFTGFDDAWEQRKLGEVVGITFGQSPNGVNYTDNPEDYILVQGNADMKNNRVFPRVWTTQVTKTADRGDLLISVRAPVGEVGKTDYDIVIGRGVASIKGNDFIYQSLIRMNINGFWKNYSSGSTFESINSSDLKNATLFIPGEKEQLLLGIFFNQIDNLITLHQRKLENLKNIKKSMLEKMFPKIGSNIPEIRFAGFTDPWEQRKLGELSEPLSYGMNAASTDFDGINKYIRITDIDDETRMFNMDGLTSPVFQSNDSDKYKLDKGDLLFARTGASVGKTYIYKSSDGLVYFAGFLIRARIKPDYVADFVFQNTLTERYKQFIQITSQRSGQPGVNAQEYESFSFFVPKKEEQRMIGNFFSQFDNLITLHQRKLENLKNIKKSMLDKMFV